MPFNWKDTTQNQLSSLPNGGGMQQQNNILAPLQQMQQKKRLTGSNPNPKFPRARDAWEKFKQFFGGQQSGVEQYATVNPQQQAILQLLQQLGVYGLQNPYEGFEDIAQQEKNQFQQETVPGLAHQFTSLGNASLSSPAFQNRLGRAGAGLHENLAAQKAGFGQQNMQQILQMLQLGLQPQSENIYRPGQPGLLQNTVSGLVGAAPSFYQSHQIGKALKGLQQ